MANGIELVLSSHNPLVLGSNPSGPSLRSSAASRHVPRACGGKPRQVRLSGKWHIGALAIAYKVYVTKQESEGKAAMDR